MRDVLNQLHSERWMTSDGVKSVGCPICRKARRHINSATKLKKEDMKNVNFDKDDWECIYTCVFREYKHQYAKVIKDALGHKKVLDDTSAQKWLNLLHKIEAHIEMHALGGQNNN